MNNAFRADFLIGLLGANFGSVSLKPKRHFQYIYYLTILGGQRRQVCLFLLISNHYSPPYRREPWFKKISNDLTCQPGLEWHMQASCKKPFYFNKVLFLFRISLVFTLNCDFGFIHNTVHICHWGLYNSCIERGSKFGDSSKNRWEHKTT